MKRIRRQEMGTAGFSVVGYVGDNGDVVADVEDRFNTPLAVEIEKGLGWVRCRALAETGIYGLTISDIVTLGFTTDEYKCMLRHAEGSDAKHFIRNEYELTALMAGKVPSIVEELRLAYQDAKAGDVPAIHRPLPSRARGERTRGSDWENQIHALGWVNERRERVRRVPDRFRAEFVFIGAMGQQKIAEPLAETGIRSLPLVSMVALGFSRAEFIAMSAYESETGECIQSEEELDEIMLKPPSAASRALS